MFDKATLLLLQVIKRIYQGLWFILHQSNEGGFRFGGVFGWVFFFGRRLGVAKKSHKQTKIKQKPLREALQTAFYF